MDAQTALYKLEKHLLGKDWVIACVNDEAANEWVVNEIMRIYPAVDESPIDKWRRRHRKCAYCHHCTWKIGPGYFQSFCKAKQKGVDIDIPRPFCSCFELEVKKG